MSTLHEAILSALDPQGCRFTDEDTANMAAALGDLLAACERADETWDLTIHPGPKPGAPQSMSTPTEAWLPTEGIRNLIARALGGSTEPAQPPAKPVPCPEGFHWNGQSFRSCDECGLPAWEHEGIAWLPKGWGPFSKEPMVLKPWGPGEREACRRKWDPDHEPAQAEPRVWRVTQTPRGNRVPVHIDYAVIDGAWSIRSDRTGWRPSEDFGGLEAMQRAGYVLSEVSDQAGEAR